MRYIIITTFLWLLSTVLLAQSAIAPTAGDGTTDNPYEISSLGHLYWLVASDDVVPNPDREVRWSSHYIQTSDINASSTTNWFEGQGWDPIGYYSSADNTVSFTGSYNGQDNTIDGLYINRPETNNIGLFGRLEGASIKNLGVTNVNITGQNSVGGLAGQNRSNSAIDNCYSSGTVSGYSHIGGLAGFNTSSSTISNSHSSGIITSIANNAGGLLGTNSDATIIACHSTAEVNGYSYVGGLVGWNNTTAMIDNSSSEGDVTSNGPVGGLVGVNQYDSVIQNSHSTGGVISYGSSGCGSANSGGLLGMNQMNSVVENCYSTSTVTGTQNVGGLVGDNTHDSIIRTSYSSGDVSGTSFYVGGLVGNNSISTIENCYSTATTDGFWRIGGLAGSSVGPGSLITNSYSTGLVTGTHSPGGLVGYVSGGEVINSYWNSETSGQSTSYGGESRTTSEMTYPYAGNTYVNWDFTDIWIEDSGGDINSGYPFLNFAQQGNYLPVPTNVTIEILNDQVTISWDDVEGANSYKIYTTDNPYSENSQWLMISVVDESYYIDELTSDRKFYRITASTEVAIKLRDASFGKLAD